MRETGRPATTPWPSLSRREGLALAAVLLVAGALRLSAPGISQFRLDEAHVTALALGIVDGRAFPLVGTQSSVGVFLPPLADYVYALPLVVWKSPLSAVLLTGLLNLAAVALAWATARRWWGRGAGLAAAALMAANPWAVAYSRQVWQPDLLPPLAMACVATGLAGFLDGRRWAVLAHLALLAAAINTHFAGALLVPITLVLAIVGWRRIHWGEVAGGLAAGAIVSTPYLLYLWRDRAEVWRTVIAATGGAPRVDADVAGLWRMMLTGDGAHALLGTASQDLWAGWLPLERAASWLLLALVVAGALACIWRAARGARDGSTISGLVAVLWAALPLLAFTWHSTPVHIHYLAMALPAAPLVAGSLVGALGQARRRWPVRVAGGISGGVALAQAALSAALLAALATRATPGGFALPLGQQVQAARAAQSLAPRAILLVPGDNATSDEWAAVLGVQMWGTPHRLVDGRHAALLPAEETALLVAPGAETGLATYALLGALDCLREIPGRSGEPPLVVARVRGGVDPGLRPAPTPALLANGVEMLGYRLDGEPAPGRTVTWRVGWRVAHARFDPARTYHIFNHLLAADGTRVAQADANTLPTAAWAVGDTVVQSFTMALPADAAPGPYTMCVGMYTFPEMENQPLLDAAGLPASDGVILGPLSAP